MPLPSVFAMAKGLHLEFDDPLAMPLEMVVPLPDVTPGTEVVFMEQTTIPDAAGIPQPFWVQVEAGVVGDDGYLRTTSPPWDGIQRSGNYILGYGFGRLARNPWHAGRAIGI